MNHACQNSCMRSATVALLAVGILTVTWDPAAGGNVSANITDTGTNVGIGTAAPTTKLEVASEDGLKLSRPSTGQTLLFYYGGIQSPSDVFIWSSGTSSKLYLGSGGSPQQVVVDQLGRVGIGTLSPLSMFHVAGDTRIDGNIAAKYQDVAEWVRTSDNPPPGTVVAIDPSESNRVVASAAAYDMHVAGVVSAQPGILLGEPGADKAKIAQSGRVKVKVDAKYGKIAVGDLLVSSPTLGHAMRSVPVEVGGVLMHRPGTLIGKALEQLTEGQGEILVLLTLQ